MGQAHSWVSSVDVLCGRLGQNKTIRVIGRKNAEDRVPSRVNVFQSAKRETTFRGTERARGAGRKLT
jgi:hypothetical protein